MALKKSIPIPLYYQLVEQLREQLQMGELEPGAQLPSERELSEQFGISRMTVRQAIAYLVQQGLLVVKQGVGTFVAEPKLAYDALQLLGFTEEMIQYGETVASRTLEQVVLMPPKGAAKELQLGANELVVKIVRLRLSAGVPLLLEKIFVPTALCPGLENEDLAARSLYMLLEHQYGLYLKRAQQTVEATIANEYESDLLEVEPGTPLLLLEGVTYDQHDRPVEYCKAVYRGDRFKFELESQRVSNYQVSNASRVNIVLD